MTVEELTQAWEWDGEHAFEEKFSKLCSVLETLDQSRKGILSLQLLVKDGYAETLPNGNYKLTEKGVAARSKFPPSRAPQAKVMLGDPTAWAGFRKLARYYAECTRYLEKPEQYIRASNLNETVFIPKSVPHGWLASIPSDCKPVKLSISYTSEQTKLIHTLSNADAMGRNIYIGYPLLVNRDGDDVWFTPVGVIPVTFADRFQIKKGTLELSVDYASAYINPRWISYAIPVDRRQLVMDFLTNYSSSHAGLIDLSVALDEALSETSYPNAKDMDPNMPDQVKPYLPSGVRNRLCNTMAVFLSSSLTFTKNLYRELRFIADEASAEDLDKTALAYVFRNPPLPNPVYAKARQPLRFTGMNVEQREAVKMALNKPVVRIQGPPGTGKSQVASNLIANAVFRGETVMFSSRNHEALHAIQGRTACILSDEGDFPLVQFCSDQDHNFTNPWYGNEIRDVLGKLQSYDQGLVGDTEELLDIENACSDLDLIEAKYSVWNKVTEDYEKAEQDLQLCDTRIAANLQLKSWQALLFNVLPDLQKRLRLLEEKEPRGWIGRFFYRRKQKMRDSAWQWCQQTLPDLYAHTVKLDDKEAFFQRSAEAYALWKKRPSLVSAKQAACEAYRQLPPWNEAIAMVESATKVIDADCRGALLARLRAQVANMDEDHIDVIKQVQASFKAQWGGFAFVKQYAHAKAIQADTEPFEEKLKGLGLFYKVEPAWATTLLSQQRAFPLLPGIVDQMIIDEAAQCNPAEVIPALYRAKRIAIIGDPKQFRPIAEFKGATHDFLWQRYGMRDKDLPYSLPDHTAYDVVYSHNEHTDIMLKEHFRCEAEIAQFFSDVFYNGELRVRTEENALKYPRIQGFKKGIVWESVTDSLDGEVEAAVRRAKALADADFAGTIGIITPMRFLVDKINRRLSDCGISQEKMKCSTAYSYQGGECDVIILVLGYTSQLAQGQQWYISGSENANILNVAVSRAKATLVIVGDRERCRNSSSKVLSQLALYPKTYAEANRRHSGFGSVWEERFSKALEKAGIATQSQYPLVGRYLDLAYVSDRLKLDIEVDGATYHLNQEGYRKLDDLFRDRQVQGAGWAVQRFWVEDLKNDMDGCVAKVKERIAHQG